MYIDKLNNRFSLSLPNDGIHELKKFSNVIDFNKIMNEKISLCDYCVDCEIEWGQCSKDYKMEDFVVVE